MSEVATGLLGGTPSDVARPVEPPASIVLPKPLADAVKAFDLVADAAFEPIRGNKVADRVMYGASAVGDFSLIWHIAASARALGGPTREREALRLAIALGIESVLINGVVKSQFRRKRPVWDQHRPRRLRKPKSSSFPSGHATSGFMAATLLGGGAWYGAAAVVAASRVHVRIHHASDVVAGAAIGVVLGRLVRRLVPLR